MRKIITGTIFTVLVTMLTQWGEACSVCFYGDSSQKAVVALRNSVLLLLVVLLGVLAIFVKFFISVAKRSKISSNE